MTQVKNPPNPILIVDDEPQILLSVEVNLRSKGFDNIIRCQDSRKVKSIMDDQQVELLLLDLTMPYITGQEILARVSNDHPDTPVIIITGHNEVQTAVDCMRDGAHDYMVKPIDPDRLVNAIRHALEIKSLRHENEILKSRFFSDTLSNPDAFSHILTKSPRMKSVFKYCEAIAGGSYPVLISGETGTGKDLIAQAMHNLSQRNGDLVAVNVAGLDDNMFWDTLFGHVKGAYTGADKARPGMVDKAANGTLFLDEIGDLKEHGQVKLLRFLEKAEYHPLGADTPKTTNARVLVATHKDINKLQARGEFRTDLYYRLRTHYIYLPALRERKEDIPLLVDFFSEEAAQEFNKKKPGCGKEVIRLLQGYSFPGNIRELKAMVFNAVSNTETGMLTTTSFRNYFHESDLHVDGKTETMDDFREWFSKMDRLPTLKEASELLVEGALERTNKNQRAAAFMLGISPQALNQRLKKK